MRVSLTTSRRPVNNRSMKGMRIDRDGVERKLRSVEAGEPDIEVEVKVEVESY